MIFFYSFTSFMLFFFFMFSSSLLFNIEYINIKKFFFNFFMELNFNFFGLTIIMISIFVLFFIKFYMSKEKSFTYFFSLLLLFIFSMLILIYSKSFFLFFIGWEGLGSSSFLLICYYKNWDSMNNSLITMFNNKIGDIFLLIFSSMFLFDMSIMYHMFLSSLILFFIIMTKSAQFPFMSWLPAAMSAPTPISSLVHSSTLVTAGILLLSKFYIIFPFKPSIFIFIISLFSMSMSSIYALYEKDFKKIVAFSTLSQISFMLLTFSMNLFYLSLFHLFTHAFFKSMLFFSVGNVLHNKNNNQDKRLYTKFFFSSYMNFNIMMISLLSMSGLLFLSGFFSKESIIESFLHKHSNILILLFIFIISLTMIYSMKIFTVFFFFSKTILYKTEFSQQYLLNSTMSVLFSIFLGNWLMSNMHLYNEMFLFFENMILFILFFFFFFMYMINLNILININMYMNSYITLIKNLFLMKIFLFMEQNTIMKLFISMNSYFNTITFNMKIFEYLFTISILLLLLYCIQ